MDSSFSGLNLPDQDAGRAFASGQINQPVFPDFLHRQGHQGSAVSQSFPDIPSSGFFTPNPMNRFPSHWSPNPLLLRPGGIHGPINFSRNQRSDNAGMAAVAAAAVAAAERDGIPFPSHDPPSHSHSQIRSHSQSQSIPSPGPHTPISSLNAPVHSPTPHISSQSASISSQNIPISSHNAPSFTHTAHKISHSHNVPVSHHQSIASTNVSQNTPNLGIDIPNVTQNEQKSHTPAKSSRSTKSTKTKTSPNATPTSYRCGGCTMMFDTIDKLHDHVQCHETNGLYFFDNTTNTAYPRSRSTCKVTQTDVGITQYHPGINDLVDAHIGMDEDVGTIYHGGPKKRRHVHDVPDLASFKANETEDFVEKILSSIGNSLPEGDEQKAEGEEGGEGVTKKSRRPLAKYRRKGKKGKKKKAPKVACVQCPQCNLNFPRERKLKCDKCGKELTSENAFKHMKKCLGVKKCSFTCPQVNCGKKFSRKSSLLAHERSHTRETPFMCEICESVFTHADKLMKHMDMHIEHRPWKCERCPMSFKAKDHLQRHIRIHTRELPFICHCGKAFAQNWNLITHMRVHTGEKPFKCDICGKQFAHNVSKKKHMKIHNTKVAVATQPQS